MNDPNHKLLNEELEKDILAYTSGAQKSFPISKKLAASVERWPVATEEIVVYRGQPKANKTLPLSTKIIPIPFFSTTTRLDIAKRFAAYAADNGQVFVIKIQPGVRFLIITLSGESEILVAANGVAEYGTTKVRVKDSVTWTMATPVTYSAAPSGGRRKTRRRKTRRLTYSKAG